MCCYGFSQGRKSLYNTADYVIKFIIQQAVHEKRICQFTWKCKAVRSKNDGLDFGSKILHRFRHLDYIDMDYIESHVREGVECKKI